MRAFIFAAVMASTSLAPSAVSATSQETDSIVVDGETLALATQPLGPLIQSGSIELPEPDERWSSNWRGYVAGWELREDCLYLKEIAVLLRPVGEKQDAEAVPTDVLARVFGGKTEVPAHWYSGTLVLPRGKITRYVHYGYGTTYERYIILRIKDGRLISREDLSEKQYTALRQQKFAEYQKTAQYAQRFKAARANMSAKDAKDFFFEVSVEEYMAEAP